MTFAEEQQQKESGDRIQGELDRRIEKLGRKPSPQELIEIVNDTLAVLGRDGELTYESDDDHAR